MLSDVYKEKLDCIIAGFNGTKDELIPLMEAVQDEFGYLSSDVMRYIAGFLKVPESSVYGVATFYALFRIKPSGKNIIRVCRGTACHVKGGTKILKEVEKKTGLKPGQTSEDLEFSLETISCFGSCALSPVMVVNKTVYGRMTPSRVENILNLYKKVDK